jgi:hypothetical protein
MTFHQILPANPKSVANPTLQIFAQCDRLGGTMGFASKFLTVSLLALGLTGCTSSSIVNLTPRQQARNDNGLYLVEAEWNSNQRSIRYDSLTPKVIVGTNVYPMRQTQLLTNRWEALIPLSKEEKLLNYHYKFDFQYTTVPTKLNDSKISAPYQLKITE